MQRAHFLGSQRRILFFFQFSLYFTFIVDCLTHARRWRAKLHRAIKCVCIVCLHVFQSTIKKQNERAHNLIGIIAEEIKNQFNETKLSTIEMNIPISSETAACFSSSSSFFLCQCVY